MLPNTFWMVTNYTCNNRCLYCYAAEGCRELSQSQDVMDFGYAQEVMTEMKRCNAEHCLLIGGEPTLYPRLLDLIRFGTKIGLKMKLVSNGRRLSDREFVRQLKDAGLVHSSVSIEGATAEKHNEVTQAQSFQESCEGLQNLINEDVSCNSILTISLLNLDDVIPLARMVHGFGAKNILYNFSLPSVGVQGIESCSSPNPQQCADVISAAYLRLKDEGIKVSFFATLPLCLFGQDVLQQMMADGVIGRDYHCHIFYGTGAAFEPNGNVLPCTHFVNSPLFNAKGPDGHLAYVGKFDQEWEEGIHKQFVKTAWQYPTKHCKTCDLWGKCFGGCPFLWMHFRPEDFIRKEVMKDGSHPTPVGAQGS